MTLVTFYFGNFFPQFCSFVFQILFGHLFEHIDSVEMLCGTVNVYSKQKIDVR